MDTEALVYMDLDGVPHLMGRLWARTRVVPGYGVDATFLDYYASYAVTQDGNRVAFMKRDEKGISHLWIASTDHRTSPQQLASVENEDSPMFLPNGNLVYRASEGWKELHLHTVAGRIREEEVA